jgi:glucosamine--fructose-6-phosphate aminotransferase (isomerizing)
MCGVVGYVGKNEALPVLLRGLKNMEYRGYDSAGLVVFDGKKATVKKVVGRVAALEEAVRGLTGTVPANVGIAHTRWATHGGVTEKNAHPHGDCGKNIYIVHNGIVENYEELKAKLEKSGHRFISETDTEIIAHLIEEAKKNNPRGSLEEAVKLALSSVEGTYGLLVFDVREPEKIVAARNFSPLVLGVGDGEFILASDTNAVLRSTKDVIYLHDGEIVTVTPDGYRITLGGEQVSRGVEKLIGRDAVIAQKGNFPHFMLKEICEEPDALRNSMKGRLVAERGEAVLGGLREVTDKLRNAKRIIICACGSAYLAGKVGEYALEEYAGIPTEVEFASEFRYRKPVFRRDDLFLIISQSGETADTLAGLEEAKSKGVMAIGIVNMVGSTLSRETEAGVYQHIGPEIGVAATKSFISQVAILDLLTLYLGRQRELSLVMGRRIAEELTAAPKQLEKILEAKSEVKKLAQKYKKYKNFFFIGRKYNFPVALEGALKLKEIAYVHAEGCASGELKHGPLALVDNRIAAVVIAPKDSVYEKNISNINEIKSRGGKVLAIATKGDQRIKNIADDVLYIPKTLEMLTPLLSVVPLQLFAYYSGILRGYDVDKPRNLAKSVTVE